MSCAAVVGRAVGQTTETLVHTFTNLFSPLSGRWQNSRNFSHQTPVATCEIFFEIKRVQVGTTKTKQTLENTRVFGKHFPVIHPRVFSSLFDTRSVREFPSESDIALRATNVQHRGVNG
jgi:hypothetical protein